MRRAVSELKGMSEKNTIIVEMKTKMDIIKKKVLISGVKSGGTRPESYIPILRQLESRRPSLHTLPAPSQQGLEYHTMSLPRPLRAAETTQGQGD